MRVSFNQPHEKGGDKNGFGYAAKMCKESLVELGHEVSWRNPEADVEINFIQPHHWYWSGPDYRIGYVPWESSEFREDWPEAFDNVDEMWTPSPVVAEWMREVTKTPVYVYEHGVEESWSPVLRKSPTEGRLQLLHHGAEALRKGGTEAITANLSLPDDANVQLVMKMLLQQFNIHDTPRCRILKTKMPFEELVALYHESHAMVYPSWGEGFGLAPIQAMGTGMPVLITKGWAPYEYLLGEESLIDSDFVDSPWPQHHPGKMFKPRQDDLNDKLLELVKNYDARAQQAYDLAPKVHSDYNWNRLTEAAFAHLDY